MVLHSMVKEEFSEAKTLKLEVEKEPAEQRSWRITFQTKGTASTKALRWKELCGFEDQGGSQYG